MRVSIQGDTNLCRLWISGWGQSLKGEQFSPEVGEPLDELGSVVLGKANVEEVLLEKGRVGVANVEEHELCLAEVHRSEGGAGENHDYLYLPEFQKCSFSPLRYVGVVVSAVASIIVVSGTLTSVSGDVVERVADHGSREVGRHGGSLCSLSGRTRHLGPDRGHLELALARGTVVLLQGAAHGVEEGVELGEDAVGCKENGSFEIILLGFWSE